MTRTVVHRPNGQENFPIFDMKVGREPTSLAELNKTIATAKPMVRGGLKAVLGEGPIGAPLALVGEQPGDQEDRQGHPFVGPAGRLPVFNVCFSES